MSGKQLDIITLEQADTIPALFRERVARTPDKVAYVQCNPATGIWEESSWQTIAEEVNRWQSSLSKEGLKAGDRVALMLRNCQEWVIFDIAAQGLGLVTVPIYTNDRAENIGYILEDANVRVLLIGDQEQWSIIQQIDRPLADLIRIVVVDQLDESKLPKHVVQAATWVSKQPAEFQINTSDTNALASIVYTSGTTGRSKGVMLSHRNMLWNIQAGLKAIDIYPDDQFLSFLPLSHTLERTTGYYLTMSAGACVAYARSIPLLGEDLLTIKPTVMVSVPRIFERVYAKIQAKLEGESALKKALFNKTVDVGWRRFLHQQNRPGGTSGGLLWSILEHLVAKKVQAKLGGRLRFAVSGGAALSPDIARFFIGLDIPIVQGYGLTETSPVIACNPIGDNIPASVGPPLPGVEIKVGEHDELLSRSPSVMLGYWNNQQATDEIIDIDGWLHTGDKVRVDENQHIYITGRLKEIIVLSNGEKVPPADMETAIQLDPIFEQSLVIGEGKPYLITLIVLNPELKEKVLKELTIKHSGQLDATMLQEHLLARVSRQLRAFPGYATVRRIAVLDDPWSVENNLITPTLKPRRAKIMERFEAEIKALYVGH
ncbi:MAG: long-chain fatty acid--CoA ligase [Candidatus Polarisedimenticolaceae bacterium]|nr:long-chain fatty acid--CoA ligase [Candidatus Polarisedimenticolaceae bacterium]